MTISPTKVAMPISLLLFYFSPLSPLGVEVGREGLEPFFFLLLR
jgi:hypothetical protein